MRKSDPLRTAERVEGAEETGTIYRVPGEFTTSGKDYIGRHNKPTPQQTRRSDDGRDRTQAEVVDRYDPNKPMEGRIKEQEQMDVRGGVPCRVFVDKHDHSDAAGGGSGHCR